MLEIDLCKLRNQDFKMKVMSIFQKSLNSPCHLFPVDNLKRKWQLKIYYI